MDGDPTEVEMIMERQEKMALPCGLGGGEGEELSGPSVRGEEGGVPVPPREGGPESSGNEIDMETVVKVRRSMSRNKKSKLKKK